MAIRFNFEKSFTFNNRRKTKNWIKEIIRLEGKNCGDISYDFVCDQKELEINKEFLSHDFYTDIITFDYVENDTISGDIFISVDRVKENAKEFNSTFDNEIHRVIIHGVLHLLGYKDHTKKDNKIMRQKEDEALKLFYEDV